MSSNKTIAKNTLMLYIRMLISMFVGLYTSRVVLQTLGVEDYGIYGIVGGVVAMMGFINASMSGATSRFITFELGKGDENRLRDTFCSALIVHVFIAFIVILLGETIGLWFLNNKLTIPADRMYAAHWVYQLSIITAAIGVTQAPYTACIMSHEKMDIYAYFELLNVCLKLLIVYLLIIVDWDKLIVYAVLITIVSVFMQMLYRYYCIRHYKESSFHFICRKKTIVSLLSFSVWDLYGNMSFSVVQQGRNFIVNIFFGVLLNAASSIATTVQGIVSGFSSNIIQAIRPQIIKSYATGNYERMQYLIIQGAKLSFLLQLIIALPLIINCNYVLKLWLGEVPAYSSSFCQILLFSNSFNVFGSFLIIGIHASGNIKRFFYTGTISMIQLVCLYFLFMFVSEDPNWTYYIAFIFILLNNIVFGFILKKQVPFICFRQIIIEWLYCIIIVFASIAVVRFSVGYFMEGWIRLFSTFFLFFIELLIASYFLLIKEQERRQLKKFSRKLFIK